MAGDNPTDNTRQSKEKEQVKKPDPSIFGDLWQAMKYSAVQEPYNGVSQLVNHLGGHVKERNLVDKPAEPTSTLNRYAQDIGYGVGKLPGLAVTYLAAREGYGKLTGETSNMLSAVRRAELSVNQLAISGGLYDGLTTTSSNDHFWTDRAKTTVIGGLTMYTVGKTQTKLLTAMGLTDRAISTSVMANIGRQAESAVISTVSGMAGGLVNSESSALLNKGRFATVSELQSGITTNGVLGFGLGGLTRVSLEQTSFGVRRTGMPTPPPIGAIIETTEVVKARPSIPNLNPPTDIVSLAKRRIVPEHSEGTGTTVVANVDLPKPKEVR